ncbi:MAG: hypothetical protein JWM47_667 [Acidimicrobiales bacterium]|nr:hypothetical protein [Acidimicrobiales bacterium]
MKIRSAFGASDLVLVALLSAFGVVAALTIGI